MFDQTNLKRPPMGRGSVQSRLVGGEGVSVPTLPTKQPRKQGGEIQKWQVDMEPTNPSHQTSQPSQPSQAAAPKGEDKGCETCCFWLKLHKLPDLSTQPQPTGEPQESGSGIHAGPKWSAGREQPAAICFPDADLCEPMVGAEECRESCFETFKATNRLNSTRSCQSGLTLPLDVGEVICNQTAPT